VNVRPGEKANASEGYAHLKRMSLQPCNRRAIFGDLMADSIRKFQRRAYLFCECFR
jgi:hypothetical protein